MALWHQFRFSLRYKHQWQCSQPLMAEHPVDGRWRFTDPSIPSFLRAVVRLFAAPVQAKPKEDSSAQKGTRLNKAITARFVRLVTAEGHGVVPIHEALDQAVRLKLDLVEVQGTANPPVCKIMDFNKEKYIQEIKEKERAQSKTTLRTGDNKEVRFKAKTEPKDLKIKADAITRLMERGYRVKCMAMPAAGQGEENLGSMLSRLLALIEDVALVESGPHVSATQAYVIVRHNKFATKKSGKKTIRPLDECNKGVQVAVTKATTSSSNPTDAMSLQTEEELEPVENTRMGWSGVKPTEDASSRNSLRNNFFSSEPVLDVLKPKRNDTKEPAVAENNRYSKQDAKDRFHPMRSTVRVPQHAIRTGSERQGQLDPRQSPQFNPGSPSFPSPQFNPGSPSSPLPQFNRANLGSPSPSYGVRSTESVPQQAIRNESGRQFNPANFRSPSPQFSPANPSSSSPSYGIFSAQECPPSSDHDS